jgi:hypothetical protein
MKGIFIVKLMVAILLGLSCTNEYRTINVLSTKQTPQNLYDSLNNLLFLNASFQFYYPYRGYNKNIIRVELDTIVSVVIDVSELKKILFLNDSSSVHYNNFVNQLFNGNITKANEFIFQKLKKYIKGGIQGIVKQNNYLNIQTVYQDSTFELIKSVRNNFNDRNYQTLSRKRKISGYCIGFFVFYDNNYFIDDIYKSSSKELIMLNERLFYYRKPM